MSTVALVGILARALARPGLGRFWLCFVFSGRVASAALVGIFSALYFGRAGIESGCERLLCWMDVRFVIENDVEKCRILSKSDFHA